MFFSELMNKSITQMWCKVLVILFVCYRPKLIFSQYSSIRREKTIIIHAIEAFGRVFSISKHRNITEKLNLFIDNWKMSNQICQIQNAYFLKRVLSTLGLLNLAWILIIDELYEFIWERSINCQIMMNIS